MSGSWWALVFVVMTATGDVERSYVHAYYPPSERWRCEAAAARVYEKRRSELYGAYCAPRQ